MPIANVWRGVEFADVGHEALKVVSRTLRTARIPWLIADEKALCDRRHMQAV